jgi:hypothetical protein
MGFVPWSDKALAVSFEPPDRGRNVKGPGEHRVAEQLGLRIVERSVSWDLEDHLDRRYEVKSLRGNLRQFRTNRPTGAEQGFRLRIRLINKTPFGVLGLGPDERHMIMRGEMSARLIDRLRGNLHAVLDIVELTRPSSVFDDIDFLVIAHETRGLELIPSWQFDDRLRFVRMSQQMLYYQLADDGTVERRP